MAREQVLCRGENASYGNEGPCSGKDTAGTKAGRAFCAWTGVLHAQSSQICHRSRTGPCGNAACVARRKTTRASTALMLDSTLRGGQLEWRFCNPVRTVVADSNAEQGRIQERDKATNGPLDGHEGPRLYGNRNQQRRLCLELNSGRSNLRSVFKSTPDPPDACSKERAQTTSPCGVSLTR